MYLGERDLKQYGYRAVYEVPIQGGRSVFMSVSPTQYMEHRSVVIVDTERFLALWRACPYPLHKEIAHGSPDTWEKDYKYEDAKDGFSAGEMNPVPLARINFSTAYLSLFPRIPILNRLSRYIEFVSFTNGITRTIWLFCQGAPYFPVEVNTEDAEGLAHAAGVSGSTPVSVACLFTNNR